MPCSNPIVQVVVQTKFCDVVQEVSHGKAGHLGEWNMHHYHFTFIFGLN